MIEACKRGHARTKENTYVRERGDRECKICRAEAASLLPTGADVLEEVDEYTYIRHRGTVSDDQLQRAFQIALADDASAHLFPLALQLFVETEPRRLRPTAIELSMTEG